MKKIKMFIVVTILFIFQVLSFQSARAGLLYPVDIDSQPVQVRIFGIKIKKHDKKALLSGQIKRRSYNSHVVPGHIYYSIFNGNGQTIKEGIVNYSASLSLRRLKQGSYFSFEIPDSLPEGSRIRLGWQKKSISCADTISRSEPRYQGYPE
ncbi:MAG: hypothetical protein KZQ64_13595 [gamma proteobacterium symbiont of Bathyaustriella thionipta]|nr:hypothetical protein [gamma proteobacterium symbiont of Bathyaustriella thionipta]MCU7949263.1 hypothetical protein [gamma proteobacterium symbiont of Bathyaustriella thionipta]MCU7954403.1 hypothetical protein [gamma proteobacterium symbiont of Bathyaustriella thionipta]MCU7955876.1 hypothetical protein [gamma proteobacterium symbiont of Bathyaustriella thionipta]MCU7966076.1 hypothetical protein [gamma proteobacterium symbiont of Bathyaustriella thionipta]